MPGTAASRRPGARPRRIPGELRRSQLLEAGIQVFAKKGFDGAKTREIAAAAGINEAVLFRHFPTKDDLYAAILEQKSEEDWPGNILRAIAPYAEARDDQGYFETFASKLLECLTSQTDFYRLMLFSALEQHELARVYRERKIKRMFRSLAGYIALRQKDGVFRGVRPLLAARSLTGMISNHVLTSEIYGDNLPKISHKEVVTTFVTIFLSGLKERT